MELLRDKPAFYHLIQTSMSDLNLLQVTGKNWKFTEYEMNHEKAEGEKILWPYDIVGVLPSDCLLS